MVIPQSKRNSLYLFFAYNTRYARDSIPKISKYPDGQTAPNPSSVDFKPGELLGCVSGELGLRKFLEKNGHTLVVTSDKVFLAI
jgi:formate dehydrogenase